MTYDVYKVQEESQKKRAMQEVKGYKINHVDKYVDITKEFAKQAAIINTPEYNIIAQIRKDFPKYDIYNE